MAPVRCADEWLRSVVAGTRVARGGRLFSLLVRHLASSLGRCYALIGELMDGKLGRVGLLERLRAPAPGLQPDYCRCAETGPPSNDLLRPLRWIPARRDYTEMECALAGIPSDLVVERGLCVWLRNVRKRFRENRLLSEMGAESCMGAPAVEPSGYTLGILAVSHNRPIDHTANAKSILTIFAARATVELEHLRANSAPCHGGYRSSVVDCVRRRVGRRGQWSRGRGT